MISSHSTEHDFKSDKHNLCQPHFQCQIDSTLQGNSRGINSRLHAKPWALYWDISTILRDYLINTPGHLPLLSSFDLLLVCFLEANKWVRCLSLDKWNIQVLVSTHPLYLICLLVRSILFFWRSKTTLEMSSPKPNAWDVIPLVQDSTSSIFVTCQKDHLICNCSVHTPGNALHFRLSQVFFRAIPIRACSLSYKRTCS